MTITLLRHDRVEPETARHHIANGLMLLSALEHEVGVAQSAEKPGTNQANIAQCFADVERRMGDALDWLDAQSEAAGRRLVRSHTGGRTPAEPDASNSGQTEPAALTSTDDRARLAGAL